MTRQTLTDILGDLKIDDPLFEQVTRQRKNQPEYQKLLNSNPNLIVLCEAKYFYEQLEPEPDTRESKAFLNLLKLLAMDFEYSRYFNSRIGWLIWFLVCYAKYDSYFPMKWCFHYDPAAWYKYDEPQRPPGMERILPDDPFNLKGEVKIHDPLNIHKEWWEYREEDKKLKEASSDDSSQG
jgi:hypothetical protein